MEVNKGLSFERSLSSLKSEIREISVKIVENAISNLKRIISSNSDFSILQYSKDNLPRDNALENLSLTLTYLSRCISDCVSIIISSDVEKHQKEIKEKIIGDSGKEEVK